MYLFHFALCIFSLLIFSKASKLTCNQVTNSNYYEACKVTFRMCHYSRYYKKCDDGMYFSTGTDYSGLKKKLDLIKFNPEKRIAVITHGFLGDPEWMREMGRTWALMEDVNVILVEWPNDHSYTLEYRKTALLTESVAKKTAKFLEGVSKIYRNHQLHFHFVGHSLGAHVVGQAARMLNNSGIRVDRITALDPARPCFGAESEMRLRKSDAKFVDVIHSNSGPEYTNFGIYEPIGHADFYPNGGNNFSECRDGNSMGTMFKRHLFNCDRENGHLIIYYLVKEVKIQIMKYSLQLFADDKVNEYFLEHAVCNNNVCNHQMATQLFIQSLNPNNKRRFATSVDYPNIVTWNAICHDYPKCNRKTCVEIGYRAEKYMAEGSYYLSTANYFDSYYHQCKKRGL